MLRAPARYAAAAFAFAVAVSPFAPASAETPVAPVTSVPAVTQILRSINPSLGFVKARSYAASVLANAVRTGLDPRLIMSIVTVESGWHANAVSRVGARGLGQLMPGTARTLGVNPRVPSDNLRGTSTYLRQLVNRFSTHPDALKLAIAGYNAGPKAVENHGGIPPYAETQRYVVKVLRVMRDLDHRIAGTVAFSHRQNARRVVPPDEKIWTPNGSEQLPFTPLDETGGAAAPAAAAPSSAIP